jgi:hypothetical protein
MRMPVETGVLGLNAAVVIADGYVLPATRILQKSKLVLRERKS